MLYTQNMACTFNALHFNINMFVEITCQSVWVVCGEFLGFHIDECFFIVFLLFTHGAIVNHAAYRGLSFISLKRFPEKILESI